MSTKYVLSSCSRDEMDLMAKVYNSHDEAYEAMLKEVYDCNRAGVSTLEELKDLPEDEGEYISDDEIWVDTHCGTCCWLITEVSD